VLTVNGKSIPLAALHGKHSVLDACRVAGAHVPAFCHEHRVSTGGHCRMCMVEVDGRVVAACATPARPGLSVQTDTPRLRAYREDLGELVVSESAPAGRAGAELAALGVSGERYPLRPRQSGQDATHPYLRFDMDACILCRLCVRACDEIQGQFVYAVEGRGAKSHITWGPGAFTDSPCVSCGACASICPTGAISDRDRQRAAGVVEDRRIQTTCSYCGVGCQLEVHAAGDLILRIEGARSPVNNEHLCVKGRYAHTFVQHEDRLREPLMRKSGVLTPVSWREALDRVADEFRRAAPNVAMLSSSRCTNEENYLAQKWFRGAYDTNNVDCCARVCHAPSAAGMRRSLGTGAATNSLADLDQCDVLLLSGSNTTESHPVTGARIKQAALRGTRLIVVDPRRTELARMADIHLQLEPGTNIALLNSLAAAIVDEDLIDRAFVTRRTEGFTAFERFIRAYLPEDMEAITGVAASLVRRAARLYAGAARPMQAHGLGMTEHFQGSEGVMLLCNLALLVGAVGREGVGVNPLRGQNNVQGAADMGCQPDLTTGYQRMDDPDVQTRFAAAWGRPLPTRTGLTLPQMYDAARRRELKAMYIFGEDVVQTDPDAARVVEALQSLEFLAVQEIFPSRTSALAHVVLPGASFLEKDGTFTNGERRIQRVRQVLDPVGDAKADWRVLTDLMAAAGWPQSYQRPGDVMDEIARVHPGFAGVTYPRLAPEGLQWPVPAPGHPGTPRLHGESFPLPGGKAVFVCVDALRSPSLSMRTEGDLLLITGRVLAHYNSGSMTRRTPNADLEPGDRLQVNPLDAELRGLRAGDRVRLKNRFGEANGVVEVTDDVAPGTIFLSFHYPESDTNLVTSDVMDRISGCPEYKLVPVALSRV
jgi:formate dehydrogenase major subunit